MLQGFRATAGKGYAEASADLGEFLSCRSGSAAAKLAGPVAGARAHWVNGSALTAASAKTASAGVSGQTCSKVLNKNLKAEVNALAAGTKAEWDPSSATFGVSVGTHIVEASAGPFAVRLGAKVGVELHGGVPVIHAGPVSAPCCIQ